MDFSNTIPTAEERIMLIDMLKDTTLDYETRGAVKEWILFRCNNYTAYQLMMFKLEDVQTPFNVIPNPSMTDIDRFMRKIAANTL